MNNIHLINLFDFATKNQFPLPQDFWIFWEKFYNANIDVKIELIKLKGNEFNEYLVLHDELQFLVKRHYNK